MEQPPVRFSQQEMARRLRLIDELLARLGLDALLVYGAGRYQADIHWATDWPGGREGYTLFFPAAPPVLLVQFYNHVPTALARARVEDVRWAGPHGAETAAQALREGAPSARRVGIAGALPFEQYLEFAQAVSGVQLQPVSSPYRALRLVKSEEEIARLRYAAQLADLSMEALRHGLQPGLPQDRMPALIEVPYLANGGYSGIHYLAAMPMDGPYLSVPAQYLDGTPLAQGDVVITEITACYEGYQGQIHRTYSIGRDPTPSWLHLHDAALRAFEEICRSLVPGRTAEEVLSACGIVEEMGFTILDDLVHGADQLPPVLRTPATQHQPYPRALRLAENMVLVVQPNLVDARTGQGLQFGETVVVRAGGPERLHAFPQEWVRCG